jgi:outer membrane protein assembly factor BamA
LKRHVLFLLIPFFLFTKKTNAQDSTVTANIDSNKVLKIAAFNLTGNKKTKDYYILRQVQFNIGDTLLQKNIKTQLERARVQVYNTNLFNEVSIDASQLGGDSIAINIKVKERWYLFPLPQFGLVDRNIKEWISRFNADLSRTVYGVHVIHNNVSGKGDILNLLALNGYSRQISASYAVPFSNRKMSEGFAVSSYFLQNREIGLATSKTNKILFYRRTGFIRDAFGIGGTYAIRKGIFKSINFSASATYQKVDDSTIIYNPNYFDIAKTSIFFPDIAVSVSYANTDKNVYPTKGRAYSYGISKRGLGFSGGINSLTLSGNYRKYIAHKRNFYSNIGITGLVKLPFEQAYINQRAIGYGNLRLRGMELYVVDAVAAGVANYTFRKRILNRRFKMPIKINAIPFIPVQIYAKTYADAGFGYLPKKYTTTFNNKLLYTGGIGIDILTVYDIVFRFEYSFNKLGESGLAYGSSVL